MKGRTRATWPKMNMSHAKKGPVLLVRGFVGDEILSSCMGIIINHEIRIPELNNQYFMESKRFFSFFVAHMG